MDPIFPPLYDDGLVSDTECQVVNWASNSDVGSDNFIVSPSSYPDVTYTVESPADIGFFPEFTLDQNCDDANWGYNIIYPATLTDTNSVLMDSTTKKITVFTNDWSLEGTHLITVEGTLLNLDITESFTFNVII